jgi:immunity protein 10 of polymorphic toxin system
VHVLAVAADDDAEHSLLAFAASEEHPDDVLIVARAKRMTAQDAALGQDTYCVVTGSSGARHYGGIDEVEWTSSDRLHLSLTRDAAETLQLPRELDLVLPDAEAAEVVRRGLPALLGREAPPDHTS